MFPVPGSIFYPVQRRMHSPVPSGGSGRVNTICCLFEGKAPLPHPFPSARLPAVLRQNRVFFRSRRAGRRSAGLFLASEAAGHGRHPARCRKPYENGPLPGWEKGPFFLRIFCLSRFAFRPTGLVFRGKVVVSRSVRAGRRVLPSRASPFPVAERSCCLVALRRYACFICSMSAESSCA